MEISADARAIQSLDGFQSLETFTDRLCKILRRDRQLAKGTPSYHRDLAKRLAPMLWSGACAARNNMAKYDKDLWREAAILQVDLADKITRNASQLSKNLSLLQPFARDGYLILGCWPTVEALRPLLKQLADEITNGASIARRGGTRGPRRSRTRDRLSRWVAIQLKNAGIRTTTTKHGTFTSVLSEVQLIAGFKQRSPAHLERDASLALADQT